MHLPAAELPGYNAAVFCHERLLGKGIASDLNVVNKLRKQRSCHAIVGHFGILVHVRSETLRYSCSAIEFGSEEEALNLWLQLRAETLHSVVHYYV